MSGHAHVQIADTAKGLAHELYDNLMFDNRLKEIWTRQHPDATPKQLEDAFVAKHWGKCIPMARATLAHMLTTNISEVLKASILDALIKDQTLRHGRETGAREISAMPRRK